MKRIPYDVRVEYWRFQFAKLCFTGAQDLIQKMVKESLDRDDLFLPPLMISAIVYYARPSKQRRPFRFAESIVPEKLMPMHLYLITLRDKTLAHIDTDGPELGGNVTNKLLVQVLDNNAMHLGLESVCPSPKQYATCST